MRTLLRLCVLLTVLLPLPVGATIIGVSGNDFTIDGLPRKLACVSYFDGKEYKSSDLVAIKAAGYNCLRVFVSWIYPDLSTWDMHDADGALTLRDNFNRTNEGPPPSASWTTASGNGLKVLSATVAGTDNASGGSDTALWNTSTVADQEWQATLVTPPAAGVTEYALLYGRCTANNAITNCYRVEIDRIGSPRVRLFVYDASACASGCQVGPTYSPASLTSNQLYKIQHIGNTHRVYVDNVLRITGTNSTHTGAGYGGIGSYLSGGGAGGVVRWDDFKGGPVGGTLDNSVADVIENLTEEADALGMTVKLVLAWHNLSDSLVTVASRQRYFQQALARFKARPNALYDLHNEHNAVSGSYTAWGETPVDMQPYFEAARAECPSCLLTASTNVGLSANYLVDSDGNPNNANIDAEAAIAGLSFLAHHFERNSVWAEKTAERINGIRTRLTQIGRTLPIFPTEEIRFGNGGGLAHEPTVAEFSQAATEAMQAGAAGWLWHTDLGFDLRSGATFIGGMNADETTVFAAIPPIILPTVGSTTPIVTRQICPLVHTDNGTSVVVTCPSLPAADSVMLFAAGIGEFNGAVNSCLGNAPLGVQDSTGQFFDLAIESPLLQDHRGYLFHRYLPTAISNTYSMTLTCPAPMWLSAAAIEVSGLLSNLSHDVSGWAGSLGGSSLTVPGFAQTAQANELALAIAVHGGATSVTTVFTDAFGTAGGPPPANHQTYSGTGMKVASGVASNDNVSATTSDQVIYPTVVGPDVDYEIDLVTSPNCFGSDYALMLARVQQASGALNGYRAEIECISGANRVRLFRYDAGNDTQIGNGSYSPTTLTGRYRLRTRGSTISLWHENVERITATDTTYPGAGYVGFGVFQTPAGAASGATFDNEEIKVWSGPTVSPAAGWQIIGEQEICRPGAGGHLCVSIVARPLTSIQTPSHTWTYTGSASDLNGALATFKAADPGGGTILRTLTWTDNATNETSYRVQKRTDQTAPNWVDVQAGLPPGTESYTATLLPTETGDCWRVWADRDIPGVGVLSAASNQFCVATTPPPPPPPPTGLTIGQTNTLLDEELL